MKSLPLASSNWKILIQVQMLNLLSIPKSGLFFQSHLWPEIVIAASNITLINVHWKNLFHSSHTKELA